MGEPATPSAAVLIVEDEPLIRMGAVYLVEGAGFTVYEAGSGSRLGFAGNSGLG